MTGQTLEEQVLAALRVMQSSRMNRVSPVVELERALLAKREDLEPVLRALEEKQLVICAPERGPVRVVALLRGDDCFKV